MSLEPAPWSLAVATATTRDFCALGLSLLVGVAGVAPSLGAGREDTTKTATSWPWDAPAPGTSKDKPKSAAKAAPGASDAKKTESTKATAATDWWSTPAKDDVAPKAPVKEKRAEPKKDAWQAPAAPKPQVTATPAPVAPKARTTQVRMGLVWPDAFLARMGVRDPNAGNRLVWPDELFHARRPVAGANDGTAFTLVVGGGEFIPPATPTNGLEPMRPVSGRDADPAAGGTSPAPTPQKTAASGTQAVVERPKAQPTGLERLSDDWPKSVKVGVQYRGRVEAAPLSPVKQGEYDSYYLNRFRMRMAVQAQPWLAVVAEAQDSQALGYTLGPVPRQLANTLDLRQAYVEMAMPSLASARLRVGRQELFFGDGRLMASPDWGNTNRTFDVVRLSLREGPFGADVFGGAPVVIQQGGFDHHAPGEHVYGVYGTVEKIVPKTTVEPYAFVRTLARAQGERGEYGDMVLQTAGVRWVAKFAHGVDVNADTVVQRGHVAGDRVSAWASHQAIGWTRKQWPFAPRFAFEYNVASGDRASGDGTRQTFDPLYPSGHAKYGLADLVGWRNVHHLAASSELTLSRKWKVTGTVSRFFVATAQDGYYAANGTRLFLDRRAQSRDLGWEVDGAAAWTMSKEFSLGAGLGMFFVGDFLDGTAVDRVWAPYLLWNVRF